jgi:hypothetical protein
MSLIKEGWYNVSISALDWMENKAKTGHYLRIAFRITSHPEYEDKTLYEYLNFDHPSEGAVAAAKGKWAAICRCCKIEGLPTPDNKEPSDAVKKQLIYAQLAMEINQDPQDNGYVFYKIKKYLILGAKEHDNPNTEYKKDANVAPKDEAPPAEWDDMNDNIPF